MEKQHTDGPFIQDVTRNAKRERFVDDELNEGVLIHAKTTVPVETFTRETMCKPNAPSNCLVGIPCPDDLPFNDTLHTKNVFHNEKGGEFISKITSIDRSISFPSHHNHI
jgi:hypothetical protein